ECGRTGGEGRRVTRLYFMRGRVGVAIEVKGENWSAAKIGGVARPIDEGVQGLLSGSLKAPPIPADQLAHMPASSAAPGALLGTAELANEAWATVDRDASSVQIRDTLAKRGPKILFRPYLLHRP